MINFFEHFLRNAGAGLPFFFSPLFLLILAFIKIPFGMKGYPQSQHVVKEFVTSTSQFYSSIEIRLKAHQIPRIKGMRTILKAQGGWFSKRRSYLKIKDRRFQIYVCSFPYGTSTVFSWRMVPKISVLRWILLKIPVINMVFGRMYLKETFFRSDAQYASLTLVNDCVEEEIKKLTESKGVRLQPKEQISTPILKAALAR